MPDKQQNKHHSHSNAGRSAAKALPEITYDPTMILYRVKATYSEETFLAFYEPDSTPASKPASHALHAENMHVSVPELHSYNSTQASFDAQDTQSEEATLDALTAQSLASSTLETTAETEVLVLPDLPLMEISAELPDDGLLHHGTKVIASTRYGMDICIVQGRIRGSMDVYHDEPVCIERLATAEDLHKSSQLVEKEARAFEICRQKIAIHNLPMKLISAHYMLEEPKILFFMCANTRVDFRELVKDLVAVFKMRIELRQIGVRDEARITGGCGICARALCCNSVSDKLEPVSIKMAKDQNLSLNSTKISGPCGRLLCCLAYEYRFYSESRKILPQEGDTFVFEDVQFKVIEINAIKSMVKIAGSDGRVLSFPAAQFENNNGHWKLNALTAEV